MSLHMIRHLRHRQPQAFVDSLLLVLLIFQHLLRPPAQHEMPDEKTNEYGSHSCAYPCFEMCRPVGAFLAFAAIVAALSFRVAVCGGNVDEASQCEHIGGAACGPRDAVPNEGAPVDQTAGRGINGPTFAVLAIGVVVFKDAIVHEKV